MTAPDTPVLIPTLTYVPHDRFVADVEALAAALAEDGWRPDHIVGIGRGGLVPAAYLSHRLDVPMLSLDHSSGLAAFAGALMAPLAALCREGRRLLFVDDINDSGSTIVALKQAIAAEGAGGDAVRFAVLIDNSRSRATVSYRARTIDRAVDKDWFVFPWEAVATADTLVAEAREVPERLA